MSEVDLVRVRELRGVVRWSADPRAFDLLRGMREARWAVAESRSGALSGMVGAVPLGRVGILCHLAVDGGYRGMGLGTRLSQWAVRYLRSRGAEVVRLDATGRAEGLYRSLGFVPAFRRVTYRLDEAASFAGSGKARRVEEQGYRHGYRVSTLAIGDLAELYGLDYWSYGADRSALILSTLRLHPGGGLVARDTTGRIKGYLVRSSASGGGGRDRTERLGPFAAESPGVARLLLENALLTGSIHSRAAVEATVPGPAESPAHALFAELGFVARANEARLRMELGAPSWKVGGLDHYGTTPYLAT